MSKNFNFVSLVNLKVKSGIFLCQICKKEYKRKGSLAQHIKRVHKVNDSAAESEDQLSAELVVELLNEAKSKLVKNGCFSNEIKSELSNYAISQPNTVLQKEVETLYNAYTNGLDREGFYGKFYAKIVSKAKEYFPGLGRNSATLLSTKLADHLLAFKLKQTKDAQDASIAVQIELSATEKDGLHYIGGYVLHKLHRKLKNSTHWRSDETQQSIALLEAGKMNSEDAGEETLVTALSRGGLWSIKPCIDELLIIAEKNFRQCVKKGVRSIDTKSIIEKTLKDENVLINFNMLVADSELEVEDELIKLLLHSILSLYVRVRAFSSARDVVQKFKMRQGMSKKKGLRKELKRSSEAPTAADV